MIRRTWARLPVVVRAILIGILVGQAGTAPVTGVVVANINLAPGIPWSVPLACAWLWLFWRYAGGHWWPASTAATRRMHLRAPRIPAVLWGWSLLAGGLTMAGIFAAKFALARVTRLGYAFPDLFAQVPPLTMTAMLLALSAMAGIVEEAAWRGYMQSPIERRHGPVVAIAVVSLLFGLAHLTDLQPSMTALRMIFILIAGVFYGVMAHIIGSIAPGIVLHATGDAIGIGILWWQSLRPAAMQPPEAVLPGADARSWLLGMLALLLIAGGLWALRATAVAARKPC